MKKFISIKVGVLLFLFCFMSILIYNEYRTYENTFEKEETLLTLKGIQVQKEVLSPLTKMSKSAGRDHIQLKMRYGYLSSLEIENLGSNYSEFNTGLLVEFEDEIETQKWLELNAYKYGFILRYPEEKEEKTNKRSNTIYRYVGVEISNLMQKENLCYEEYLERE